MHTHCTQSQGLCGETEAQLTSLTCGLLGTQGPAYSLVQVLPSEPQIGLLKTLSLARARQRGSWKGVPSLHLPQARQNIPKRLWSSICCKALQRDYFKNVSITNMVYGKMDVAGNRRLSKNWLIYNVCWEQAQQGLEQPPTVCARNPWASPHPHLSRALHGSGPIPRALRCHVNRAVCAYARAWMCVPVCLRTHHCLGNPHIWLTRDQAIPRRHNWEGQEDSGQECVSSPGSTELTLWHQSSGSVLNADLLPPGKVRKEIGAQRALSWLIMEVWENGTILWVPLVFTCGMKGLLFLCPVSHGQSPNRQGDSLAGYSFPSGDVSRIFGAGHPARAGMALELYGIQIHAPFTGKDMCPPGGSWKLESS